MESLAKQHTMAELVRDSEYVWTLNLADRSFSFESLCEQDELNISNEGQTLASMMQMFTVRSQSIVKRAVSIVYKQNQPQNVHCCIKNGDDDLVFCDIFIEKFGHDIVQGHVKPLILIPKSQSLAELFETLFENDHHGIVLADADAKIIACNHYFERQSGYKLAEIYGLNTNIFNAGKHTEETYKQMWRSITEKGYWTGELISRHAKGHTYPESISIQAIEIDEQPKYYLAITVDRSNDLNRLQGLGSDIELTTQLLKKQAFIDTLTQRWADNLSKAGHLIMVMKPDIKGDDVELTAEMAVNLMENPCAELNGYFADGIFIVALEFSHDISLDKHRSLQARLRRYFVEIKNRSKVGHSQILNGKIGVSVLGQDANSVSSAISHAAQAMMEMHGDSQATLYFYDQEIHEGVENRKKYEQIVSEAIKTEAIEVFYQPIVETNSWQVVKFEALCRFKSGDEIVHPTQELINTAEDLGVISEVDRIVGKLAMQQLENIQFKFGAEIGITVNRSINTHQSASDILTNTAELVDTYSTLPEYVTIELTESAYFDSEQSQKEAFNELRKHGVSIAIDDFGTGYSSFSYLSDFNFDILKVDKKFVQDVEKRTTNFHIVKAITYLAHTLGITVVVEGVESKEQVVALKEIGVDYMQGYFFSEPLPTWELEQSFTYRTKLDDLLHVRGPQQYSTIYELASERKHTLDPGDFVSLAYEYFRDEVAPTVPVLDKKRCVGILGRREINLFLTPRMGTDLETSKNHGNGREL
ncbi:EAL domain-containing protein [Vibrio mexicanus]|uniref:bifunctional diguanylate cyclase/phosphodiesterase n=1 Tax=Vibrio mexicanus TaxID=1004326 RepID=UPI00069B0B8E|nr:EAL domain-containing protein [Vibrio mexicanus]